MSNQFPLHTRRQCTDKAEQPNGNRRISYKSMFNLDRQRVANAALDCYECTIWYEMAQGKTRERRMRITQSRMQQLRIRPVLNTMIQGLNEKPKYRKYFLPKTNS